MALVLIWVGVNVASFALFGWDKMCAENNRRRVPEAHLLLLALSGGALGALLGQQVFRHKTKKQPFRTLLWCAAAINILAALVLLRFDWLAG